MADRKPVGKARLTRRSFVIAAAASGGGFALGFHLGAQAQGVGHHHIIIMFVV